MDGFNSFLKRTLAVICLCAFFCSPLNFAETTQLTKLKNLVSQKHYPEAYTLGESMLSEHEGTPSFDMLYGEAALNTNHLGKAAFAYERVLILQPTNYLAHLQLALVRYSQNQLPAAEAEVKLVLSKNPPARVRKNIEAFQARIKLHKLALSGDRPKTSVIQLRFNSSVGHDTNVNSATSDPTITDLFIPPEISLKNINLASSGPLGVQIPSDFARVGAVIDVIKPLELSGLLKDKVTYFATLFASYSDYLRNTPFDLGNYYASTGFLIRNDNDVLKLPIRVQALDLQSQNLLRAISVAPEILHRFSNRNTMGLSFEYGSLTYPNTKSLNQQQGFGTFIWQHFNPDHHYYFEVNLFGGDTQATQGQFAYNGRAFVGYRIFAQWNFVKGHQLYLNFVDRNSWFDKNNPSFVNEKRRERFQQILIGWDWNVAKNWWFKTYAGYAKNRSTIDVYRFKRQEIGIGFEYRTDSLQWADKRRDKELAKTRNPANDLQTGVVS